jgi:DNA-binding NarL/FixJ family response regulator
MQASSIVLLQSDFATSQALVTSLSNAFRHVHVANSIGDVRVSIAKRRAEVVILDIETTPLSEVEHLSREFPGARIICTHRLADEAMCAAALNAGAADMYPAHDTRGILTAALRTAAMAQSAAA